MHTIQSYLTNTGTTQAHFANALGVTQGTVAHWIAGRVRIPAERCAAIERATDGVVTRHDLRPDIWPEPAEVKRHVA